VQNIPVSVFYPVKCLHALSNRLEKVFTSSLNLIEISIGLGLFILIKEFK